MKPPTAIPRWGARRQVALDALRDLLIADAEHGMRTLVVEQDLSLDVAADMWRGGFESLTDQVIDEARTRLVRRAAVHALCDEPLGVP